VPHEQRQQAVGDAARGDLRADFVRDLDQPAAARGDRDGGKMLLQYDRARPVRMIPTARAVTRKGSSA
jgi:hypothetical protein